MRLKLPLILCLALLPGCVEETVSITSKPAGAEVWLNDQLVGRTPVTREVEWDGDYDIILRAPGYETLKTHKWYTSPLWLQPPFDLLAESAPWKETHHEDWHFDLTPSATQPSMKKDLITRAQELRSEVDESAGKK